MWVQIILYGITFIAGYWLGSCDGYKSGAWDKETELFNKYECEGADGKNERS